MKELPLKKTPLKFPAVFSEENFLTYVIQPGDTLLSIAAKYQITCQELSMLNPGAALSEINAGKTLRIPDR